MSINFQINERIGFLKEKGMGIILECLSGDRYRVSDEDGFERVCRGNELIRIHSTDYDLANESEWTAIHDHVLSQDLSLESKQVKADKEKFQSFVEIDLHMESLVDSHVCMTNTEILQHQLYCLRQDFLTALQKRPRKIIIIHGVGEGVLKQAVRDFLSAKTGVSFYDADYREYGKGATAVEIRYTCIDKEDKCSK